MINLSYIESIAILSINRPEKLNALGSQLMAEIHEKLSDIDQKANVLIINGCGRAFAAGMDVSEINALSFENAYLENFIDHKWESIFDVKIPVIAAVSGYALGGGFELALMCDIIVASRNAIFGFPEVNLGIMPGMGGTQLLTRIVGIKVATEILMTGRFLHADEAKELKIISKITEDNDLIEKTIELAKIISQKPISSIRMIKDAVRMSQNTGLYQGMKSERQMFRSSLSTSFKQECVAAFLNKKI